MSFANKHTLFYIPVAEVSQEVVPSRQVKKVGSQVSMFCDSDTTPHWTKDNTNLSNRINNIGFKIVITKTEEQDSGKYACTGTYRDGEVSFTAHSSLYVGCKY